MAAPASPTPGSSFGTFDEAFAWLASRTNYETMATQRYDERTYGLARVERLLDDLGRPDHAFETVQIVGSKGKGSTAAGLDAILRTAGRRSGLYTSPHLVHARERIRVDGQPIPDALFCEALSQLRAPVDGGARDGRPCTFFEIHTAAALLAFRAAGCETVVLEAGMGGRLDATSAARAAGKILTTISLDHVRQLGRTHRSVAREKAAAARAGVPLISGVAPATAAGREVEAVCAEAGAPLLVRGRDFHVRRRASAFDASSGTARTTFRLALPGAEPLDLELPLLGRHQADNAALAAVAALRVPWKNGEVTRDQVRVGLAGTSIAARLQVVSRRPLTLLDGAHSPTSLARLAEAIRDLVPHRRATFVVGIAADKGVTRCVRALRGVASEVIGTSATGPRAAPPADVAAAATAAGIPASEAPDLDAALALARGSAGPDDVVVVTGSLYLCGAYLSRPEAPAVTRPGE